MGNMGDGAQEDLEEAKKTIPQPISVEKQICNLKRLGLTIEDDEEVVQFLNDVSYYRVIKAFSHEFKPRNGKYNEGSTFDSIKQLYLFNAHFRQLLFPQIEKIEINFRCRVSNYFSLKYGSLGYLEASNFSTYPEDFGEEIANEITRSQLNPHIKNFIENYENGSVPFYAAVEVLSFGTLSKFYKNMFTKDKKDIASKYGVNYYFLESWMECIASVRNTCAHYGRLYNISLIKKPTLYNEDAKVISNERVMAAIICIKRLLPFDEHWEKFVMSLDILISEYPGVDVSKMGFPGKWKEILLDDKH